MDCEWSKWVQEPQIEHAWFKHPYITKGRISQLDSLDKNNIVDVMCEVFNKFNPCGINETSFYHLELAIRERRAAFTQELMLSLESTTNDIKPYFLVEGFVLLPGWIIHWQSIVCVPPSQVNLQQFLALQRPWRYFIRRWEILYHFLWSSTVPYEMCIGDFIKRELQVKNIMDHIEGNKSTLPNCHWLICPLLNKAIKRVELGVNSNAKWDKPNLLDEFMTMVQSNPISIKVTSSPW